MPSTPYDPSRREILRRAAAAGLLIPAGGLLGACATGGGGEQEQVKGKVNVNNPLGIKTDAPLEIVIFDGGYGDKYATDIHEPMFKAKYPQVQIKHSATEEIAKTLQPRFAGGNPPDFVNNSGADSMDYGALSQDGQLQDLSELLEAPAWDDPNKKVKDTLIPSAIEWGTYDGKFSALFYVNTVWGIWYSQKAFNDNGWQPPKTWAEFTALCETINKSGTMAPFTYAGVHAYYIYETILTSAAKLAGPQILTNIDNLEDGAWLAEPVKQAATAWAEIGAKYLMEGTGGLDHTQTQTAQNKSRVAMLPCGSWLENEQKDSTPEGFDYAMFPVPPLTAADKMPAQTLHASPGEGYMASAKSANPRGAMEYMRAMLSREGAGRFMELVSSITVVKGAEEGRTFKPGLTSAVAALNAAGANTVGFRFNDWYKELDQECRAASTPLMTGKLSPTQWCERMQKKADKIKSDSSIKKFKR